MAAADGNEDAQYALGLCYEEGMGVEKDLQTAAEMYISAASRDHEDAKKKLKKLKFKKYLK